jgi:5-methylcytosine-specific restriction protein A
MIDIIKEFVEQFKIDKLDTSKATKNLLSWNLIVDQIPIELSKSASLNKNYLVTGSIGKGLISETAWIGVFDKTVTSSAQTGFYIVYLFCSDLSGFYISLNQGWTQYELEYGVKEAKEAILTNATKAQGLLKSTSSFSFEPIDLKATKILAKGYELGNICSKFYSMNALPSDQQFIDDLRNLIGVYRELKGLVGSDILDLKNSISEDEFQASTQKANFKTINDGPIKRKEKSSASNRATWPRDPNIAFTALLNANFICENDVTHKTFTSAKGNHQFMEAHHLIPIEFQDRYENSLDVPENIISLCPNCHRAIHLSQSNFKNEILIKFFEQRINGLIQRGLNVVLEDLLSFY